MIEPAYQRSVRRSRLRDAYESLVITLASALAIFAFMLLVGLVVPA